jgi:hypothetical protein
MISWAGDGTQSWFPAVLRKKARQKRQTIAKGVKNHRAMIEKQTRHQRETSAKLARN